MERLSMGQIFRSRNLAESNKGTIPYELLTNISSEGERRVYYLISSRIIFSKLKHEITKKTT